MDAKTYAKNTLVTENRDYTAVSIRLTNIQNIRLIHASAGITSEIAEILELSEKSTETIDRVNLLEEMGDILYYVAIASDQLNAVDRVTDQLTLGKMPAKLKHDDDLSCALYMYGAKMARYAGEFADLAIKKFCFYGKPFNAEPLIDLLFQIHYQVQMCLAEAGYTVEEARERNIAKLKARYGDKFSEAAALERNLEAERKILENK